MSPEAAPTGPLWPPLLGLRTSQLVVPTSHSPRSPGAAPLSSGGEWGVSQPPQRRPWGAARAGRPTRDGQLRWHGEKGCVVTPNGAANRTYLAPRMPHVSST